MDAGRLIFLDETWATISMAPTWGSAPKGERCVGYAPQGHWHTTTFVCALSTQGLLAPLVLDGPINGAAFVAWVEQFLVPELRAGDTVVMDNLSSHKVAGVKAVASSSGHLTGPAEHFPKGCPERFHGALKWVSPMQVGLKM